jgi:hypothetical protein
MLHLLFTFSSEENRVVRVPPVTLVAPRYVACHIDTASSVEIASSKPDGSLVLRMLCSRCRCS